MTPSTLARPLLLLGLFTTFACGDDETSGSLTVEYELGPGLGCADASLDIGGLGAVETIRVTLTRGTNEITEEAPCLQGDTILVASAPSGNYDMLVEGVDAVGDTVMDNLKLPMTDEKVEVIGGSSQNVTANLAPTPAEIQVRLNILKDGVAEQCQFADVQFFDVTAFRGSTPMLMHQIDYCMTPSGYQPIPDPERVIEGALLNSIKVEELDMAQAEVADLAPMQFSPPGAGKLVQMTITCDGTDCSGNLDMVGGGGGGGDGSGGSGDDAPSDDGAMTTSGGDSTGGDSTGG
jgi:hypothetical protein